MGKDSPNQPHHAAYSKERAMEHWEEVTWHVYQTTAGRVRVEAPRTLYVGKVKHERPLKPAELRAGEKLVATVEGHSKRTVETLIRRHRVAGLLQAVADMDVRHKTRLAGQREAFAESTARINKRVDLGPQPRHQDQDKPATAPLRDSDLLRSLGLLAA